MFGVTKFDMRPLPIAVFLLAIGCATPAPAQSRTCEQMAAPAHVAGVLVVETFPGPPNYESIANGDQAETYYMLRLDRAVCVSPDSTDELSSNEPVTLETVQLVFTRESDFARYRGWLRRHVRVSGEWMPAHTAHHRTSMLIVDPAIRLSH